LTQRRRNFTPYNPLIYFTSFLIRRRWKHLRYVIFAVLLLAMAAFVTVEVEIKGKKPDDCSCSNFWSILDSFYWKK